MKRLMVGRALFCACLVFGTPLSAAPVYTTLSRPGTLSTSPKGVWISGTTNISGSSQSSVDFNWDGFLYDGTSWTDLSMPGADRTYPNKVSGDKVVGSSMPTFGSSLGFVYSISGGTWTTLDKPGATQGTWAMGVSGTNIVGQFSTSFASWKGFLYNGTTWTDLDLVPGWDTQVQDIYGMNVVGNLGGQGFIYNITTGTWTTHAYPGASGATYFEGIYEDQVVGSYQGNDGNYHGLIYNLTSGNWTSFDVPAATSATFPEDIYGGVIVGTYSDDSGSYAFMATGVIPEPSTLGLFATAAVVGALVCAKKRKFLKSRLTG